MKAAQVKLIGCPVCLGGITEVWVFKRGEDGGAYPQIFQNITSCPICHRSLTGGKVIERVDDGKPTG